MKFHKMSKKVGLKPGSIVYVGRDRKFPVTLNVIDYSESEINRISDVTVDQVGKYRDSATMTWIDVCGIHDPNIIADLGKQFDLSALILEDIANARIRPKFEELDSYLFVVLKMLKGVRESGDLESEQTSVLFGQGWVITFQEAEGDVFEPIRNRLVKTVPRVKFMSSDYLAYAIIDSIVDHYFVLLEQIGDKIEQLDDAVTDSLHSSQLLEIRNLKKQLVSIRKAIWPLREVIGGLQRTESNLVSDSLAPYLRDLYEHVIQVIDTVEGYRDLVSGLLEQYNAGISNRMNEIMKVLTIFASIFIPLGFLAGVYGMNFDSSASQYNMPELAYKYGYLMFWGFALTIVGGLVWYFRRRKWL